MPYHFAQSTTEERPGFMGSELRDSLSIGALESRIYWPIPEQNWKNLSICESDKNYF
jgi:hypothetical protein